MFRALTLGVCAQAWLLCSLGSSLPSLPLPHQNPAVIFSIAPLEDSRFRAWCALHEACGTRVSAFKALGQREEEVVYLRPGKKQCERCALLICFTCDSEGTSRSHLAPEIPLQELQHHDVNLYSGFHLQCHARGHQSVAVKDVPSLLCSHIVSYTGVCQVCHINESKVSVLCSIYHSRH